MLDIGMTELLVIGIVALIVVGPKDLPVMFRTLGRFTGKMRSMAREFQRAMEDAADESGMKDIQKNLKGMKNPKRYGLDKLDEAASAFEKWEPGKSAKGRPAARNGSARPEAEEPEVEADEDLEALQKDPAADAHESTGGTAAESPLSEERQG